MSKRFLANISKYRNAVGKAAKHEVPFTHLHRQHSRLVSLLTIDSTTDNQVSCEPIETIGVIGSIHGPEAINECHHRHQPACQGQPELDRLQACQPRYDDYQLNPSSLAHLSVQNVPSQLSASIING